MTEMGNINANLVGVRAKAELCRLRMSQYLDMRRKEGIEVDEHDIEFQGLSAQWDKALVEIAKIEGNHQLAEHIKRTPFISY